MSAEWVTAYATVGTLVVIAATGFAAIAQLRHARSSNQIAALSEFRERLESSEFRDAEEFVSWELPELYKDPAEFLKEFRLPLPERYRRVGLVANFFEVMGLFVKYRVLDADLTCDVWAYVVLRNWRALAPIIAYARRELNNRALFENFEYLAVLSDRFTKSHASVYPAHLERMPEDTTLVDAARSNMVGRPDPVTG